MYICTMRNMLAPSKASRLNELCGTMGKTERTRQDAVKKASAEKPAVQCSARKASRSMSRSIKDLANALRSGIVKEGTACREKAGIVRGGIVVSSKNGKKI